MAVIHRGAQISPTKLELAVLWLQQQPWAAQIDLDDAALIGGYRFDDPDGKVGVEAMLVRHGEQVMQTPFSYRGAPLAGAEEYLVTTMEHSSLGLRWIYRAEGDPVAMACFTRALRGEQEQAAIVWHHVDGRIEHVEAPIQVQLLGAEAKTPAGSAVRFATTLELVDGAQTEVDAVRVGAALVATWSEAGRSLRAVVAELR